MDAPDDDKVAVHLPHHVQQELCTSRATYRQGRKLTAVKVYTVNNESQHLLVYRVPAIKLQNELSALCSNFGTVSRLSKLELIDPGEEFTDVYHVCYSRIREARRAKRGLDGRSFYGSPLHVCYAPELESVEETRLKLINRRNEVAYHTGRKMKVPNLSLKRSALQHQSNNKFKLRSSLGPRLNLGSGVSGPPASSWSNSQPSTSSKGPYAETSMPSATRDTQNHSAVSQHPSTSHFPLAAHKNGAPAEPSCTGEIPALPGFYDVSQSYPSQEVLRLPGLEVKQARDRKFMPSSVVKRAAPATPNKIVFHKKPKQSDAS